MSTNFRSSVNGTSRAGQRKKSYHLSNEDSDGGLSSSSSDSSHKSAPNYIRTSNQAGGELDLKLVNGGFDSSKLEDDLLKLDQTFSANKLFDNILGYSSHSVSGSSSEAESMFFNSSTDDSMVVKSYTSSCDWEPRAGRHSWAGQLEIINTDTEKKEQEERKEKRAKRRDERKRHAPSVSSHQANGTVKSSNSSSRTRSPPSIDNFTFDSQESVFSQVMSNIPILRHFLKGKRIHTQIKIRNEQLQVRFITSRDFSCSKRWTSKSKITILLVDITNIYIFNQTDTIVIQFTKCESKATSKHLKHHTRHHSLTSSSGNMTSSLGVNRTSLSSSKPLINQSISGTPSLELELNGFNNCQRIVRLILDKREELLPKSIMKRSSVKSNKLKPVIIPAPVDIVECVSYI